MAIFRVNKTSDYTVLSNRHLKEREMTLKAKGLLTVMLSLPEGWDYSVGGLVAICKENESAIKSTLDELKRFGYLIIEKKMPNETATGRIEYEYNIYEQPQKQEGKKQGVENQGLVFQGVENQGELNKEKSIPERSTTNDYTPEAPNGGGAPKDDVQALFAEFWEAYPRKVDKKGAERAFLRVKGIADIFPQMMDALAACKRSEQWTKDGGQYIPHPTTWIRQERWTATIEAPNEKQGSFDVDEFMAAALARTYGDEVPVSTCEEMKR